MDAKFLRLYFSKKYQERFNINYISKSSTLDIVLFKALLAKYNEYIILEAIDNFLTVFPKDKASINYFATSKVFESLFKSLILLGPIIKYRRHLKEYSQDIYPKVKSLLDEFTDYSLAMYPSSEEINRKSEIINELEVLSGKKS